MKLLRQPNEWSCLPTALAMLIDTTPADVIMNIGHDGSEPSSEGIDGRRAFCDYEITLEALRRGYYLVPILRRFVGTHKDAMDEQTFKRMLESYSGILVGNLSSRGRPHSVAWHNGEFSVYDPARPAPMHYDHFNRGQNIEVFYACPNLFTNT